MPSYSFECEVCGVSVKTWRSDHQSRPRFCSIRCRKAGMIGQRRKCYRYVITPEMHERIRHCYLERGTGNGQVTALSRALGLPAWKISRYAIRQGWCPKKKKEPPWSEEEVRLLEHFARYCPETIRSKMKERGYTRSVQGIIMKLKRSKARASLMGYSANSLALCLGTDMHVVLRAIRSGQLKATRRGTARTEAQGGDMWWITPRAVKEYILGSLSEIDIRKVDKYWFVDILTDGKLIGE